MYLEITQDSIDKALAHRESVTYPDYCSQCIIAQAMYTSGFRNVSVDEDNLFADGQIFEYSEEAWKIVNLEHTKWDTIGPHTIRLFKEGSNAA